MRETLENLGILDHNTQFLKMPDDKLGLPILNSATVEQVSGEGHEIICESAASKAKSSNAGEELARLCRQELEKHELIHILDQEVPKHWEKHEDLVLFPKESFQHEIWSKLDQNFWAKVAQILRVSRLAKKSVISDDDFRSPKVTPIFGIDPDNEDEIWASRTENGIHYSWNILLSMFSVGNITEKIRIAKFDCRGQTVVDLFAGIGYFSLAYLVHAKADHVIACEWNPEAVKALRINLIKNGVQDKCTILEGDNRQTCPQNVADHVNLGLIPSSAMSYRTACKSLKQDVGGILHIHGNVRNDTKATDNKEKWQQWCDETAREIQSIFDDECSSRSSWSLEQLHLECVKSFAPRVHHLVLDLKCVPKNHGC